MFSSPPTNNNCSHSIRNLGAHRPGADLLPRPGLLRTPGVLPARGRDAASDLLGVEAVARLAGAVPDGAADLRRGGLDPAGDAPQLPVVGRRGLRLPAPHQEPVPRLVGAPQLPDVVRARPRPRPQHPLYLLRLHPDRDRPAPLVGQRRRCVDDGLSGHRCSGQTRTWRDVWAAGLVGGGGE